MKHLFVIKVKTKVFTVIKIRTIDIMRCWEVSFLSKISTSNTETNKNLLKPEVCWDAKIVGFFFFFFYICFFLIWTQCVYFCNLTLVSQALSSGILWICYLFMFQFSFFMIYIDFLDIPGFFFLLDGIYWYLLTPFFHLFHLSRYRELEFSCVILSFYTDIKMSITTWLERMAV